MQFHRFSVATFALGIASAMAQCDVQSKIETGFEVEGRLMNDEEREGDAEALEEFYKNIEWQGQKITADLLRAMKSVASCRRVIDEEATGFTRPDTWVSFWVENWTFTDGTEVATREATKAKFDLEKCELVELTQVVDAMEQERVIEKIGELMASNKEAVEEKDL